MYLPGHYAFLFFAILLAESAILFIYTAIGLLKQNPMSLVYAPPNPFDICGSLQYSQQIAGNGAHIPNNMMTAATTMTTTTTTTTTSTSVVYAVVDSQGVTSYAPSMPPVETSAIKPLPTSILGLFSGLGGKSSTTAGQPTTRTVTTDATTVISGSTTSVPTTYVTTETSTSESSSQPPLSTFTSVKFVTTRLSGTDDAPPSTTVSVTFVTATPSGKKS